MGRKTIKNVSKILPKLATKTTLQFASILNPTWLHFGTVLGAKLEPSWHQIASKVDPKIDQKNDHLLDRPKIDFWSILGSNLGGPGGSVGGPSGVRHFPRIKK